MVLYLDPIKVSCGSAISVEQSKSDVFRGPDTNGVFRGPDTDGVFRCSYCEIPYNRTLLVLWLA